ncbi:MAG: TPMT family class I SAM-dependent methyltransferase [Cyclobacteriaceae bacterium]|nr:TPMT family class I SAM-dependent methyltransferase [Cyclobacteriaceae bacterium]
MKVLDKDFWTSRYASNETGWDTGAITTPLREYIDQLSNKKLKILIPGMGNGYEPEYLHDRGFNHVEILDISILPINNFLRRCPSFPEKNIHHFNFFDFKGTYDIIIEQTFFCALDPLLRADYAKHMHRLLRKGGKLVGVLFDFPLTEEGPPFGGSIDEYLKYFEPYFIIKKLERCYNSIEQRSGREVFMILEKQDQEESI